MGIFQSCRQYVPSNLEEILNRRTFPGGWGFGALDPPASSKISASTTVYVFSFCPEHGGRIFLRNIRKYVPDYTASRNKGFDQTA